MRDQKTNRRQWLQMVCIERSVRSGRFGYRKSQRKDKETGFDTDRRGLYVTDDK